jgi:tetratricopeptide (TPR) repeat protein
MALVENNDELTPYYYTNHASDLIDNGEFAEAKTWLVKAMQRQPTASQYYLMGQVMQHEGDAKGAQDSWEKALTFNDIKYTIQAYKALAVLHFSRGDYKRAFEAQKLADSTYYEYGLQIRTTRLNDVQRRYDLMASEKAAVQSRGRWLLAAVITMGVLLFMMAVAFFYLLRARKYRGALEKQTAINDQSQKEIQHLQSEEQAQRKEAIAHKEQIQMMKNASSERLGRGKKLYETINNGGKPGRFTTTDEKNFVHYYIYTFSEQYDEISRPYQSLTLRLKTFLILQQMGKDNKEMQRLLDIKESTIRSYRYWLSLRKK